MSVLRLLLEVSITNISATACVLLYRDLKYKVMLSKSDIEYLKRVNGVRKELGLAIDNQSFNQHSFITAIAGVKNHNPANNR
jgi:hypothetical protein